MPDPDLEKRGGGRLYRPLDKGGGRARSPPKNVSALRASVWSKNKGWEGGLPTGPLPWIRHTVELHVTYPDAVTVNTTISLPRVSHVTRGTINKPASSSSFSSHFPFHLGNFIHLLKISIKKGDGKFQGNVTIDLLFDSNSAFLNKMKVACLLITTGIIMGHGNKAIRTLIICMLSSVKGGNTRSCKL